MKKWQLFLLMCLFLSSSSYVMAQNITITGRVSGSDGTPLSNVSIFVTGTNQGTSTNDQGNYTVNAPGNASLTFSYIGHVSQTVSVNNRTAINVTLEEDATSLDEVVVTALGIERSSKSLTYNTTTVSSEDLNTVKSPNVLNNLAGRAAGVFVTQGDGGPGAAPRIVLRGNKSITGDNQPLYVVDGIPVGGFSDFNQEDIESLQVLQGASAAALYGSQAANGVILITTKKGKLGSTEVNIASSAMFDSPMLLPEIQTSYGQGLNGEALSVNNDSWGPKITNGSDAHIKDFFRTGENYINSVSISSGNDRSRMYASYANTTAKAMVPGYDYSRHNFTVRGSTPIFRDKVQLDASINYIKGVTENRNFSGWYNSPMFGLYLFPMGDDMGKYSPNGGSVWNETRLMYTQNWPYIRNEHSSNQNPYWIINQIQRDQNFSRTNFMTSAKWDIADWLTATGRTTLNIYSNDSEQRFGASSDPTSIGANGSYNKNISGGQEWFSDFIVNANKNFGSVSLNAFVGTSQTIWNWNNIENGTNGAQNTLIFPNFFSAYALQGNFIRRESKTKEINRAVMGAATLGWEDKLFLDVTARNEWSTTVDEAFFYPSVGLSYILSEDLPQNDIVSNVKIRGSYAEVGNSLPFGAAERAPNYTLDVNGNIVGRDALPFFSGTDTVSLKPERTKSLEFGIDLGFFNNSLNLNVTYYNATTEDQVFQIQAPAGSGASRFWINGGTIQNFGLEAGLSYRKQFGEVTWTPSMNFTRNTNRIKQLSDLLSADRFVLNSGNRLTNMYLLRPGSSLLNGREYGAYHDLFGKTYQYDDNGNQLFDDETGLPLLSAVDDQYIGNANPDFLLNWNNQFSYKNFTLSFLLDSRWGGLVASSTEQWLDYKGLSKRSGEARDAGGVVLNGRTIDAQTYYYYISAAADYNAASQEYIFDSTNIRLREFAVGYTLPQITDRIRSINVSLIARNLFFLYKKAPFDPELAYGTGNGAQGFENFQTPSARSIGLSLRVGL